MATNVPNPAGANAPTAQTGNLRTAGAPPAGGGGGGPTAGRGGAGTGVPPTPPPPPPPNTFSLLYRHPANDPYQGNPLPLLAAFDVNNDPNYDGPTGLRLATGLGADRTNAYVGLFRNSTFPAGQTWCLHAPRKYPTVPGVTNPRAGKWFFIVGDVVDERGSVALVVPTEANFTLATRQRIPRDVATLAIDWANADPDDHVIGPFAAPANGPDPYHEVRVPKMVPVPADWVHLFLERNYSPRELGELAVRTGQAEITRLGIFGRWLITAGIRQGSTRHSAIAVSDLPGAVPDAGFQRWVQSYVQSRLTGLQVVHSRQVADATRAVLNMAADVRSMFQEQQDNNNRMAHERAVARQPKTVSEFFQDSVEGRGLVVNPVITALRYV